MNRSKSLRTRQYVRQIWKIRTEIFAIDELIGLRDIKNQLCDHIVFVVYGTKAGCTYKPMRHVVITGKSGCGKTTFANILAVLLNKLYGYSPNHIVRGSRNNMIGSFVGHTAKLTQAVIDTAQHGVLLIDEAYALGDASGSSESNNNSDTFARACINTLNQNLTEKSNDFICIVIGYQKKIEQNLFSHNEGLRRRFNVQFHFQDYTTSELFHFFTLFCSMQGITFADDEQCKRIKNMFTNHKDVFVNQVASVKNLTQVVCKYIIRRGMHAPFTFSKVDKTLSEQDMISVLDQYRKDYNLKPRCIMSTLYI